MLTKHILFVGVACMLLAAAWATTAPTDTNIVASAPYAAASSDIVPVPELTTAPAAAAEPSAAVTETETETAADDNDDNDNEDSTEMPDTNDDDDDENGDGQDVFPDAESLFSPQPRPVSAMNHFSDSAAAALPPPPANPYWTRPVDPGFHRRPRRRAFDDRFDERRAFSREERRFLRDERLRRREAARRAAARRDAGFFGPSPNPGGPRMRAFDEQPRGAPYGMDSRMDSGRPDRMMGPRSEEEAEMMMMESMRHGGGPAGFGGRSGAGQPFMPMRFPDEPPRPRRDAPLKERCEDLAAAFQDGDRKALAKLLSKHIHVSYNNHELPMGGHWYGVRGLMALRERIENTIKHAEAKVRVVAVDRGFQRCVLKANMTGEFVRSSGRFTDVTLYNTVDWVLGKAVRMRYVDGGNYEHMMQAYRTRAENATLTLAQTIYSGGKVDDLVAAEAVVTLGRKGTRFTGTGAVTEAMKTIKESLAKYGIERESLILPHPAVKSKQCELIMADEHNYAGQCRVYNLKTHSTSFKHVDVMYRFRFDMQGKLDRLNIVETRAFLPGELVDKKTGEDYATAAAAAAAARAPAEPSAEPSAETDEDDAAAAEVLMFDPARHEDPHPRLYRGSHGRRVRGERRDVA